MTTSERAEPSLMVASGITSPMSSLTLPPLMKFRGAKPLTRIYSANSFALGAHEPCGAQDELILVLPRSARPDRR